MIIECKDDQLQSKLLKYISIQYVYKLVPQMIIIFTDFIIFYIVKSRNIRRVMRQTKNYTSYLDVSQYIIKEHSPAFKPSSPDQHYIAQRIATTFSKFSMCFSDYSQFIQTLANMTPEVSPIDHDTTRLILTPITSGLIRQQIQQIMDDFILDSKNPYLFETENKIKKRKSKNIDKQDKFQGSLFRIDCQLEHIFEDQCQYNSQYNSSFSSNQQVQFCIQFQNDECIANSNTLMTSWEKKIKSKEINQQQQQRQSAIQLINAEYFQKLEMFRKHPKQQILKKMKEIQNLSNQLSDVEQKKMLKSLLEKYFVDYQLHCFQQAWQDLPKSFKEIISLISQGINEVFAKKIGPLSFEARRVKLLTYLQKKKSRKWRKKVSYDCRKRVADGRLRIKGKFVTRQQICEQLGFENLDNYTAEEIKQLLQRKNQQNMIEQTAC